MTEAAVRIAVSGHRQLDDLHQSLQGTKAAAARLQECFPDRSFVVYSCLAEGSDQLLTRSLLDALAADLIVVMPLPEQEYVKDFLTNETLRDFKTLKGSALEVVDLGGDQVRPQAYRAANDYLLAHCDVLVVIWDGLPARGEGGTGEMVAMARQADKALLWIHASSRPYGALLTEERLKNSTDHRTRSSSSSI